jgi:glucose/arabinose dehydrogenase
MWASELGQNAFDELNRIRRGRNYGWPHVEGRDRDPDYKNPFATWSPAACSPSGVAVANGRAWVGALRGQCLWSVRLNGPNAGRKVRHLAGELGRIRTVQKAPDGSLWVTTSNREGKSTPAADDDRVIRLRL